MRFLILNLESKSMFFCSPPLTSSLLSSYLLSSCLLLTVPAARTVALLLPFFFEHQIHFEHCRCWIEFVMCFHWLKAGKNSVWCSGVIKMSIFPHGYILEGMYRCYFAPRQCPRTKYVRRSNLFSSLSTSLFSMWKTRFCMYINKYVCGYINVVADKGLVWSDYLQPVTR